MELMFLGTGAGMPSRTRHTSSILLNLVEERGTYWLFDCGEAMQHRLIETSYRPRRVEKIFITHLHGDHIFGLPGFLGSRSFLGGTEELTVYGPVGIEEYIRTSLRLSGTHLTYPLTIREIEPGVVFEDEQFVVQADLLEHVIPSFGYRIVQKDLPGTLLMDKVRELGVPKGPLLGRLKKGETVHLEDGLIVKGQDVTSSPQRGLVLSILGDTRFCDASIRLAMNADVVVHEATFDDTNKKLAGAYGHSTFRQAATVAQRAGAKHLIATHISPRFTKEDEPRLVTEMGDAGCPVFIARDLQGYQLLRNGSMTSFTA